MELLKEVLKSIKESIRLRLGGGEDLLTGFGEQIGAFTAAAEGPVCLLLRVLMILLAWFVVLRCIRSLYSDGKDQELWGALTLVNGAKYELRHWENIIGRARYADIRLNFGCVSRTHATLQRDDKGRWLLYPISESSRTNVNGERIHEAKEIAFGDRLSFNGIEMFFFPASAQEIQTQEKKRVRPGGGVSQRKTLWLLTVLQMLMLLHFVIVTEAERLIKILPAFVLLTVAMWGLYFVYRLFHRAAFELETLAFFLCTVGFAVISAYAPSSLLKQFIALCIGLVLFLLLSVAMRSLKVAVQCRWPLAAAACALLTFNVLFGQKLFGAKNWIAIGPFSFQPSELVKVAFVFAGAATLDRLFSKRNLIFTAAFSCFCVGCLALMSDFGTALIFFIAFLTIAFLRSGDLPSVVLLTAAAGAGGWVILKFKPYIARRFAVWRHVWEHTDAGGYQQSRTMAAIADGGLFGKGPDDAWLKYVGAANTDLVFGVVSEEFGLLMALAAVTAIVAMTFFAVYSIKNARSSFYVIAACATATMLVFQSCLNIFGATDLLPLTGVTLPFVSMGGSSMMSCWALLAFLKAADTRKNASFVLKKPSLKRGKFKEEEERRTAAEQQRIDDFTIDWGALEEEETPKQSFDREPTWSWEAEDDEDD